MTDTVHFSEDDEPFLTAIDAVNKSLDSVREELNRVSPNINCLDCGDPIGAARKKAVPSSKYCIDCQEYINFVNGRF